MTTAKRFLLPASFAALALAVATIVSIPAESQSGGAPHQLRVIWTVDPAHQAKVSWTTSDEGTEHAVYYDTESRGGDPADYEFSVEVSSSGEYVDDGPWFHHAPLQGLQPATTYYFVVVSDGEVSRELHFDTAHDDDSEFKLLYGGDSRTGRDERQAMNERIRTLHENDDDILALVHGGDYIDWANNWPQWAAWLDDHQLTIAGSGRVLPIVPAKGNHEGRGVVYNKVFGEPGGAEGVTWFKTEIGDLTLLNLDTEVSMAGVQREWLEEQLEQGRESRWLVVNYHRPAYPAVKSASGAKEHWVPLFEQYDVDLVCESDGHTLKRTPPIREDRVDYTGVTYVGEGGLGVPQRTPVFDRWYLQPPGMATRAHHVQLISFERDFLRYGAVLRDGEVLDELTIMPREERLQNKIAPTFATTHGTTHLQVAFSRPFDAETATDPANWAFDPPLDVAAIHPGPVVDAVLALANEASLEELDDVVGLDARAARNIVSVRTDEAIASWEELDDIPYVGKAALGLLTAHALQGAENPRNIITLEVEGLDEDQVYRLFVNDIADAEQTMNVTDGATVSFVYGGANARADAIGAAGTAEEEAGATCSTTPAGQLALWPLVVFFGLAGERRARRRRSTAS